ncbi:hypothetical protein AAIG33_07695 [Phytobacter ursingii]|uniref:hypothetical protein n=1 Tax=Phytobacter ursingii TaxID=1972431 RepID=UPI0031B7D46A
MGVYKDLLAPGSISRLKGIYYNNIIASHPGSKALSIIIRTLKKRYHFLEKHNAIFEIYKDEHPIHYLARLLYWREEPLKHNHYVTPILTGPGLIIEVIPGIAYVIVDFDINTQPNQITEIMQNDKFGIAFFKHNLDTPLGLNSSWRTIKK